MDPKFFDFCVIGSGASALGFLLGVEASIPADADLSNISLITTDIGNQLRSISGTCVVEGVPNIPTNRVRGGAKTYFNNDYMYRRHELWDHKMRSYGHIPSFSFGGLTKVWGATADLWDHQALSSLSGSVPFTNSDYKVHQSRFPTTTVTHTTTGDSGVIRLAVSRCLRPLLSVSPSSAASWRFKPAHLAIRSNSVPETSCTACGACLNGCSSDAIWSADTEMKRFVHKLGQIEIGFVKSIRLVSDVVEVEFTDQNGQDRSIRARKCILAAGVPMTVKLFAEMTGAQLADGDDTPIQFRIGFALKKSGKPTHNLANVIGTSSRGHVQLYAPNLQVWERFIPKSVLSLRPVSRLLHHLVPIIIYGKPVTKSVRFTSDGFSVKRVPRNLKMILSLGLVLSRRGILLIPFAVRRGQFGESYHSGSFFKEFVGEHGFSHFQGRVYIADAAGLPVIQAGSITPTVFLNAIRLGRYLTDQAPLTS